MPLPQSPAGWDWFRSTAHRTSSFASDAPPAQRAWPLGDNIYFAMPAE